ncbi:MAG: AarF/ABC1/UbiB kinase family protein [Bacteroidia bacterium]|nr:AarF/ABC1/UbiB kinase family protein [Bacteroidia bacterium]
MLFGRQIKNIRRIREIISILLKYGFEDLVTSTSLRRFVSSKKQITWTRKDKPIFEYTRWERIRMAAEELGPTFVKLAQVLSNRPDMLPSELISELELLQNKVEPFDVEEAKAIIEDELGKKISEVFDYFEDKPIGSASIGQVHKARLKTGEEVVVKVQRPGVKELIETDLNILKDIVRLSENYLERQGVTNSMDVVESFEKTMSKELLYINEARNMEQFRNFYKDYKNFYVPKPFKEYSSERILVIEFISGCKITDLEQIHRWGLDPKQIAMNGMDIYLTQIFEYGYFHADPHPGNVLVREDGTICLIDFGMVGKLMKHDKYAISGIFINMARTDAKRTAMSLRSLALSSNIPDMRLYEYDIHELIEDFAYQDVDEASMADMSTRLQKIIYDYKMRVPGPIFLIMRALAILEGIGKVIYPDFVTMEFIKPYGAKILKEQLSPTNLLDEVGLGASGLYSFLKTVPVELKSIIGQMRKGEFKSRIEFTDYERFQAKLDYITNRLTLTFLIAALLIGSAISMTADFGIEARTASGIPYISLTGLVIAGGLTLILVFNILRSGKY